MSIESPNLENKLNNLSERMSPEGGVVTAFSNNGRETNSVKSLSDFKCKSSGSSPSNRNSSNSFHKSLELMVDKTEILPSSFMITSVTKSAQKVPSPIKEVEECSLKGFNNE